MWRHPDASLLYFHGPRDFVLRELIYTGSVLTSDAIVRADELRGCVTTRKDLHKKL
jgi:hypothetical protein